MAAITPQHGNNIFISLESTGEVIAGTRSNEIQTGCETIEICDPSQGNWRKYLAGRKDWSVTVGFLVSASSTLSELLNVGTTYTVRIMKGTAVALSGSAICTQTKITAQNNQLVQGSFTFKGSGALS